MFALALEKKAGNCVGKSEKNSLKSTKRVRGKSEKDDFRRFSVWVGLERGIETRTWGYSRDRGRRSSGTVFKKTISTRDMLNLSNDETMRSACAETVGRYGLGSCSPRGFYGTFRPRRRFRRQNPRSSSTPAKRCCIRLGRVHGIFGNPIFDADRMLLS